MSQHHHKKHTVHINKWVQGMLEVIKHEFDSFEDAVTFTSNKQWQHEHAVHAHPTEQVIKVYNVDGECVHSTDGSIGDYA